MKFNNFLKHYRFIILANLDLQLACAPETLAFHDVKVSRAHTQPKGLGQQCLERPAQTLPHPQPCCPNLFKGNIYF